MVHIKYSTSTSISRAGFRWVCGSFYYGAVDVVITVLIFALYVIADRAMYERVT